MNILFSAGAKIPLCPSWSCILGSCSPFPPSCLACWCRGCSRCVFPYFPLPRARCPRALPQLLLRATAGLCLAHCSLGSPVLSSLLWLSHPLTVLIAFSNARLSSFSNFPCIIFEIDPIKFLPFSMSSPALKAKSFVASCS